ncbi:MAG: hypothetical protein JSV44_00750 [Candidatus Zixiibacteriota bacterium]|nr:MAG: hypothetical protein JSV44_00750 [candidate division Zixibacteria bacterium]
MNINSVGIDAYRQVRDDTQVTRRPVSEQQGKAVEKTDRVKIPGQVNKSGSRLAVKLRQGAFVDMLTEQEKQALELLFDRFRAAGVLDSGYDKDGPAEKPPVGTLVDVKL